MPLLSEMLATEEDNVAIMNTALLRRLAEVLRLPTRIVCASEIGLEGGLSGVDKVLALCKAMGGSSYLNASGGVGLYDPETFEAAGLGLKFIPPPKQRSASIIDDLMRRSLPELTEDLMGTTPIDASRK